MSTGELEPDLEKLVEAPELPHVRFPKVLLRVSSGRPGRSSPVSEPRKPDRGELWASPALQTRPELTRTLRMSQTH